MGKKNSLQQKLAVAMSVVNVINAGAPVALPYVNFAGQMSTGGGKSRLLATVKMPCSMAPPKHNILHHPMCRWIPWSMAIECMSAAVARAASPP